MKLKSIFVVISSAIFLFLNMQCGQVKTLQFDRLLCEYAESPIDMDLKQPRVSWVMETTERGQAQSAFQIQLATTENLIVSGKPDMWDTGRLESSKTLHHTYAGIALESNTTYYWQVTVWDKDNKSITSDIASFTTTLLNESDWSAEWIGAGPENEPRSEKGFFMHRDEQYTLEDTVVHNGRSVLLRNELTCEKAIETARVFVTGLGFYELYINGDRVGDRVMAPAKTNYRKEVLYDTYDVTSMLKKGDNAVGMHLGNGWFNPYKAWWQDYRMQWFGAKRALLQMHIQYTDGTDKVFVTDKNWKTSPGPITFNCIYDGERYDATLEQPGWAETGFDDSAWQPVNRVEEPGGELLSHRMPPMRVVESRQPVRSWEVKPGVMMYDMGQNFTGWAKVALKGEKGTTIQIRFAEEVYDDSTLNITSNEHADAVAYYTLKGGAKEVYETRFSYYGFQFVEITAEPKLPQIESVQGQVVHTDNELIGSFECSNELINKIHKATVWSQRSNMIGYPMDCPQRDERLGWFGDAQVTAEEAMFNYDMTLFFDNWFSGIRGNQNEKTGDIPIISPRPYIWDEGIEWSSTYILMLWQYYRYYGDTRILAEHYDAMVRYMQFLDTISTDYIEPMGWIGDWGSMVKGWHEGEPESVPTAFYFLNAEILSKTAAILGKDADAQWFEDLAEQIKNAYNSAFFDPKTGNYNDGSQMANSFPLLLGIVPEQHQEQVLNNLVVDIVEKNNVHLTTGVLGTKYMFDALAEFDRFDVAYQLITQTTYPSWAEMMEKYNTMCEFWTLKQSHNHVMMGSIDAWLYKFLAGIQLDEEFPAYERFVIKPYLAEGLDYVQASTRTLRGMVESEWHINEKGYRHHVRVPFGATAKVYIPAEAGSTVFESGKPADTVKGVAFVGKKDDYRVFEIGSGVYEFEVK